MGIRVGVRFEGIKRVVDGLLDMQPFCLESIQSSGAHFLVFPMHKLVPYTPPFPQILIIILQLLPQRARRTLLPIVPRQHLWGNSVFMHAVRMSTV